MAFSSNSGGGPMAEINVTPLVDVMLVLLIIFMITAPLMTHKIRIDLPQANLNKQVEDNVDPIDLAVKSDGTFYWNDSPITDLELKAQLAVTAQKTVQPELQILEMLHLHVTAPVRFCRAALPAMIARRNGAIINVCSLAQFLPFDGNAMYSASKTFLLRHSEILDHEVGKHGIKVQALIPGYTATTFHNSDGYAATKQRIPGVLWSSADFVAATSLRDLDTRKFESIPGTLNRGIAFLLRSGVCPHRLIQRWVI